MRRWLWPWIIRAFDREFTASCIAAYEDGYRAGYDNAAPPEGAWREEFEKGYRAAEYDLGQA